VIISRRRFQRLAWSIALTSPFFLIACTSAMSTHDSSHSSDTSSQKKADLRFTTHNFAAYCFDTIGCKVLYDNAYEVRNEDGKISPPPHAEDYLTYLDASTLGISNFPPPALVTWRSRDGEAHEATVDIGEIFKDRRILHNVLEKDIPEDADTDGPAIILVVNDRTISVYMRAFIPLKEPTIPGNKYSSGRDDLMLAYSHTY
jgi:hypothetical protein